MFNYYSTKIMYWQLKKTVLQYKKMFNNNLFFVKGDEFGVSTR